MNFFKKNKNKNNVKKTTDVKKKSDSKIDNSMSFDPSALNQNLPDKDNEKENKVLSSFYDDHSDFKKKSDQNLLDEENKNVDTDLHESLDFDDFTENFYDKRLDNKIKENLANSQNDVLSGEKKIDFARFNKEDDLEKTNDNFSVSNNNEENFKGDLDNSSDKEAEIKLSKEIEKLENELKIHDSNEYKKNIASLKDKKSESDNQIKKSNKKNNLDYNFDNSEKDLKEDDFDLELDDDDFDQGIELEDVDDIDSYIEERKENVLDSKSNDDVQQEVSLELDQRNINVQDDKNKEEKINKTSEENILKNSQEEISSSKLFLVNSLLKNIKENTKKLEDLISSESNQNEIRVDNNRSVEEEDKELVDSSKIVEGIFDGEKMIDEDGKEYTIPANYISKSKLVEGDSLKLTITKTGVFRYKQIKPVERKRIVGTLEKSTDGSYVVVSDRKKWKVIKAGVTYFRGKVGDEVVILIPKYNISQWAAIENINK